MRAACVHLPLFLNSTGLEDFGLTAGEQSAHCFKVCALRLHNQMCAVTCTYFRAGRCQQAGPVLPGTLKQPQYPQHPELRANKLLGPPACCPPMAMGPNLFRCHRYPLMPPEPCHGHGLLVVPVLAHTYLRPLPLVQAVM